MSESIKENSLFESQRDPGDCLCGLGILLRWNFNLKAGRVELDFLVLSHLESAASAAAVFLSKGLSKSAFFIQMKRLYAVKEAVMS